MSMGRIRRSASPKLFGRSLARRPGGRPATGFGRRAVATTPARMARSEVGVYRAPVNGFLRRTAAALLRWLMHRRTNSASEAFLRAGALIVAPHPDDETL